MADGQSILPPAPIKTPVGDRNGFMHPAWSSWFILLYSRVGGGVTLTNEQIIDQFQDQIDGLDARLDEVEAQVSAISNLNELNQAPVP